VPIFNSRTVFEIARSLKAFLNLQAGIVRGEARDLSRTETKDNSQARRRTENEDGGARSVLATGDGIRGIRPDNLVWIFGVARTGSSWLSTMMRDLPGHARWNEPYVGDVFGYAYYRRDQDWQRARGDFVLGDSHKEVWLNSVRRFVLEGANARFPEVAGDGYLVIKEPNGSLGAPLLAEALPESRMILLVRDPRDVVSSLLSAVRKGSWAAELRKPRGNGGSPADENPDRFVRQRAELCMRQLGNAKLAYETHRGRKALVRYEDLRHDTLKTLKRIYADLEIAVDEGELRRVVEQHAWDNVPEEKKGADKPRRKATPGGRKT
jgi:hypothetical protein